MSLRTVVSWSAALLVIGLAILSFFSARREHSQKAGATAAIPATTPSAPPPSPPADRRAAQQEVAPTKGPTNFDRRTQVAGYEARQAGVEKARADRMRAAEKLRARVPGVQVDFDEALGSPKFVASTRGFLAAPDGNGGAVSAERLSHYPAEDPQRIVKAFLDEHSVMFSHGSAALGEARMARDYQTPHNGLRTYVWQQQLDGLRVFESTLQAHVTKDGKLVNIASRFVPDPPAAAKAGSPNYPLQRTNPPIAPKRAIQEAAKTIGETVPTEQIAESSQPEGPARRQEFRSAQLLGISTEEVYFPIDETALRLAWEVIFTSKVRGEMFRAIIDAEDGRALVLQGMTEYISDATYRVFTSDSPTPFSPGHASPSSVQPPQVARTLVTTPALNVVASPNGWITDGVTETQGNNVDAHTDTNADNVADLPRPQGGAGRVFDFPLNLTQAPSTYKDAAVTQLFYWCNFIHDKLYELGFTEASGNFQIDNFGRGGIGNDAVQADAQDGSGTDNANFSTPADGSPGRMQMFLWTGPTPDIDGDFDAEVVLHEYTHGLTNRLVGGGVGISELQSRSMGEGWSDFYGISLLAEAGDDLNGNWARGGYSRTGLGGTFTENYYFGGRRYPYSTNLTKNPLTFKDIDPTQADAHTGIPRNPMVGGTADQVHNAGEVWCVTLWELRARLVTKLGFAAGHQLAMQLVTDGLKLSPANPNFLQARNGIIQADLVNNGGANLGELWGAFAKRGMGAGATSPASSTTVGLVESYDLPDDLTITPTATWTANATVGGPFGQTTVYSLFNSGTAPLSWTAATIQPWLNLSATNGTLAPGATAMVTGSITAAAANLSPSTYADAITFTNTTSGIVQRRPVILTVEPFTVAIASETWESGTLGSAWAITGTSTHRTLITTANAPHGGARHLTMDSSASLSLARNEATWTVNLAGRTGVQLRFWVKMFGDEANGPPASPFVGGADFDGVAISADGTNWYEVQPLRTLVSEWTRYTVDLDAAIAARGLNYNSSFKIRFNHYDDYPISTDGFAFDDIELFSVVNNRVTITLPLLVSEGAGTITGSVGVAPSPASDFTVTLTNSLPTQATVPASVMIPAGQSSAPFTIAISDDILLDGTQNVNIAAVAAGYQSGSHVLAIADNETASLVLTAANTATEGDPPVNASVAVSAPVGADVAIDLSSSAPAEIQVPATVTIPSGQTSATFPITIVDDNRIDGTISSSVSAHVANWPGATTSIAVADNETRTLTVSMPALTREGDGTVAGSVRISGSLPTALVISLSSNDTSELTVPATVTLPAGQVSINFTAQVINDSEADGTQAVSVRATAPAFIDSAITISIADNDAHHFNFAPIAGAQIPNAPFAISVSARDVNDLVIANFNSPVTLKASGSSGGLPLTPTILSSWVSGVWAGNVTLTAAGNNVRLTADDNQGHSGTSNPFNVAVGPPDHFVWGAVSSPQSIDAPFSASLRAVDASGNTVPSYTGAANLSAILAGANFITGENYSTSSFPFYGSALEQRTQVIYLASELGGSATLTGLAVSIFSSSTGTFNNFTVRVKQTSQSAYPVASFDATGWTEVYRGSVTPSPSGWLNLPFATPFAYDGTSNLIVDFSFDNAATTSIAYSYYMDRSNRVIHGYANGTLGDPRTWEGQVAGAYVSSDVPVLRFTSAASPAIAVGTTGAFTGGVWTGTVSLPMSASSLILRAMDGALSSDSNSFAVVPSQLPGNPTVFSEDFETGILNQAYWTSTGTANFRAQVTSSYSPHGGSKHLAMDSLSGGARNETTLTVNLAGRTGVELTFWAAGSGDEASGPPTSPFTGGADFDGVAISANGTTWWEVQSLRSLPSTYAQFTVNLDAAIAALGLAYNSAFKIRFNQYDDNPLPTDGILIDDIAITAASPPNSLTMNLPTQVTEGAGFVTGTVSMSTALSDNLVVTLVSKAAAKITVPATVTIPAGQNSATFTLTVLDDAFLDGPKDVVITARSPVSFETGATVKVIDNDTATLALNLPTAVQENAGSVTATLSSNVAATIPVTVALLSSNPPTIQVPTATTLPRGSTSVSFPISVTDDGFVGGDQTIQITASRSGWTPVTASLLVQDNEPRNLAVTIPADFREGDATKTGSVRLSGMLATDLVVALSSSDTTEITVPATVTILAGQTSAFFPITIQDDVDGDGSQTFTITAQAATFANGTASGQVRDNEAHHFTFAPIASPQAQNGPVPAIITARDANGAILTEFNSPLSISATSISGTLTVSPSSTGVFLNGVWSGSVQINTFASGVVLTVNDGKGHIGSSNSFDLANGAIDRFVWDTISSPQTIDTPFATRVRAVDASGVTVPAFNGIANFFVNAPSTGNTVGLGNTTTALALRTASHDSRSNLLFLASELSGPAQLAGLAFNVTSIRAAGEVLNDLTIRLKHTALGALSSTSGWDNTGWTQVYRASPAVLATGWVTFNFTTPFDYNGTSHLLVDISFNRTASDSFTTNLQATAKSNTSTLYASSNSTNGDPLSWTGNTPSPSGSTTRADVRFTILKDLPIRPGQSGAFSSGIWTGEVSVPLAGSGLKLSSRAGTVSGLSNAFDVLGSSPPTGGGATVFTDDFESGTLSQTYWTVTGTGNYRTQVTTYTAHGGTRHMAMDEALDSGAYARNEATLTLNLSGRREVKLSFWAVQFGEESNGPPAAPFPAAGADFDGVAISADGGNNWYEVQSLRSLTSSYTQLTVDLDAAIAARGLSYSSNFKIRFNQYDNYSLGTDGIGIDDVIVTANPLAGFVINAPAQTVEGAGAVGASILLDAVATAETIVALKSSAPAKITVPASVRIPAGQTGTNFTFNVLDDTIADGDRAVAIEGVVIGKPAQTAAVMVIDNEVPPVSLTTVSTMAEGSIGYVGTLTLGSLASGPIVLDLASNDTTEITVPATVTIPAGQPSVTFPITVVNDTQIDGTQGVTITASRAGWSGVSAMIQVTDNESRALSISSLGAAYEGTPISATVSISGTLPADLAVTLTSANSSQFSVPDVVTIPAGQTSVTFRGMAVDDTATDGTQNVTVTASAPTFSNVQATASVLDNDVHHFTFGTVAANVIRGQSFNVTITARDVNNSTIGVFYNAVTLAASASGTPVSMTPATSGVFSGGSWTGAVTMTGFGTGVVLTVSDATGHTGSSTPFNIIAGTLNTLAWSTIPSPVAEGIPFNATLTARDAYGNTMTGFNGTAAIACGPAQRKIGTGTGTSTQPLYATAAESRMQCIYLASELGAAGKLTGLALDVTAVPSLPLTRFTVRIRPTTLAAYASPYNWESTGWTTVHQSNLTVANTGWLFLPFSTLFQYDGTSNLMVDFSFDNDTSGTAGSVRTTSTANQRSISPSASGALGDPLAWSGATPTAFSSVSVPNLRLRVEQTTPMAPGFVTISNGIWTGPLTIGATGTGLVLTADVPNRITGESNAFDSLPVASLVVSADGSATTTGPRGGPFTSLTRTFTVSNGGAANMAWTATPQVPWLSLSPPGGTLAPGANTTVTVTLNTTILATLPSGIHTGSINFANFTTGQGNTSRSISVTVTPIGDLAVTPDVGLAASGPFGGPFTPASQTYTLTNPGDSPLNWTAGDTAPWLVLSATSGSLAAGASEIVTASIDATSINPGSHAGTITFTNSTSSRGTTTRTATLVVALPPPQLAPEPAITPATSNTISWTPVTGANAYEAEVATGSEFTNPVSSGWIGGTSHTFGPLQDGTPYFYRARAQRLVDETVAVWSQTSLADFSAGTRASVVATLAGSVTLANAGGNEIPGRVLNPSFEANAVGSSSVNNWTTVVSGSMGIETSSHVNAAPLPTHGANYVALWAQWVSHAAGEYVGIRQSVDLTGAAVLSFDASLTKAPSVSWGNSIKGELLIDGVARWSETLEGPRANQAVSVSDLTGIHTIEFRCTVITAGNFQGQWFCVDNVKVLAPGTGYLSSGNLISPAIAPTQWHRWGRLGFSRDVTAAGTALTVDVLDASRTLLAADVAAGTDLNSLPAVANRPSIRLRANLSTTNNANTPILEDWSVESIAVPSQTFVSAWSNVETSTQFNAPPGITAIGRQQLLEDGTTGPLSFALGDDTTPADGLAVTVVSSSPSLIAPQGLSLGGVGAERTLQVTPLAHAHGEALITIRVTDGGGKFSEISFPVVVLPVNDVPAFTRGVDQTSLQNAGPQIVPGWATSLSTGPLDEAAQPLDFLVATDRPELFTAVPAIAADGTLTFTPSAEISGTATVTVRLHDGGGTENGGLDTSAPQTFTITTVFVNDAPSFVAGASIQVAQNAGPQTIPAWAKNILAGPADEANQALDFRLTVTNAALFSVPPAITANGTLAFTPAAGISGTATITVRLHDSGGTENGGIDTSAPQTFTISTSFVNDAPSFVAGASIQVAQNAGPQTIPAWAKNILAGPADEVDQALDFRVTVDNAALFATPPAIAADGTLSFTPSAEISGSATVTVLLHDGGGTENGGADLSAPQTFTISTTFVNDAPSFVAGASIEIAQDAGPQTVLAWAKNILAGPADEAGQILDFQVTVDNAALFITPPAIAPDGALTYTPAPQASGTATVTVLLHDDGGVAEGGKDLSLPKTFTIAVTTFAEEPGSYNGLVRAAGNAVRSADRYGLISITVGSKGTFTGKLTVGGKMRPVRGAFDLSGVAHFGASESTTWSFARKGRSALQMVLSLDVARGSDTLSGTLFEDGQLFSIIEADRALFTRKRAPKAPFLNVPAHLLGAYTAVFATQLESEAALQVENYPPGHGAASLQIVGDGRARLIATLANGTKFSYANLLSKAHAWPLYHAPRDGGAITGMVHFREVEGVSDLDGPDLLWFCPAARGEYYPDGWPAGIRTDLVGSKYLRPLPGAPIIPGLPAADSNGNAMLHLSGGGLAEAGIEKTLSIGNGLRAGVVLPNPDSISLNFRASTGLFEGAFKHPVTRKSTRISGAVIQKQSRGAGWFRTKNEAGSVLLFPEPAVTP